MKMDHPPLMKEETPKHMHHVHHVEKHHKAGGHVHHHHHYGQHAAGHMKEHEKVEKLCGGGMGKYK